MRLLEVELRGSSRVPYLEAVFSDSTFQFQHNVERAAYSRRSNSQSP